MSGPTFSLIHATWGRPQKAISAMVAAMQSAARLRGVEYIFAVNSDDVATLDEIRYVNDNSAGHFPFRVVVGDFVGSAPAWDAAAKVSTGEILIQMQDDLGLQIGWDGMLMEQLEGADVDENWWRTGPLVLTVKDGYRNDALLCTAICNRSRYNQVGEFLHAGYRSVFSDDEFSIRAYADEADGKCQVIRTDLVFRHENPYHTGAPHDATLLRENSPEAYAIGGKLFMERNAALIARGFKTW